MIKPISDIFKRQAKLLGLTQIDIARQLEVSLPTAKRWLSGQGVDLENLIALMDVLDLSFEDLGVQLHSARKKSFRYTVEQEDFFADYPQYLAYFDRLLMGDSPVAIAKAHGLCRRSTWRYISQLEELGLIEIGTDERVRLMVKGEPVWRKNGPLVRRMKRSAIDDFLDQSEQSVVMHLHEYHPDDVAKIKAQISELKSQVAMANSRGKHSGRRRSYGVLIGIAEFEWRLLNEIPQL